MKKKSVIGKWLIACSLGVTAISVGGVSSPLPVYAEEATKQVDYEKAAKEFISLAQEEKWDSLYPLLSKSLQKHLPQEQLPYLWSGFSSSFGTINQVELHSTEKNGLHTKVKLLITTEQQ